MKDVLQYGDAAQVIYDRLKARIVTGELVPGEELKIMTVATEYGVSTVTVREAVRMLASDKLLELRPRRSPVVILPDLAETLEMNEIRLALEPIALKAAMANHTKETIDHCFSLIAQDQKETDEWRRVELNREFHLALLAPCGRARLLRTIDEQYEGISRLAQFLVIDKVGEMESHHHEHQNIVEAVSQGKGGEAVKLLKAHINASKNRILKLIQAQDDGSIALTG